MGEKHGARGWVDGTRAVSVSATGVCLQHSSIKGESVKERGKGEGVYLVRTRQTTHAAPADSSPSKTGFCIIPNTRFSGIQGFDASCGRIGSRTIADPLRGAYTEAQCHLL